MTMQKVGRDIFHRPCAYNPSGVSRETCRSTTCIPAKNIEGCARISCTSPLRVCSACLVQGGTPNLVTDYTKGLCSFHSKNGAQARVPREMEKGKTAPRWMRTLAEPIAARAPEPTLADLEVAVARKMRLASSPTVPLPTRPASSVQVRPKSKPEHKSEPTRSRAGRKRGSIARGEKGTTKIFDLAKQEMVTVSVLEAIRMVQELRAEGTRTQTGVQNELRLNAGIMNKLMCIESLEPEVQELLSLERPPLERLGTEAAALIALFKPELQEKLARQYLSDEVTLEDIRQMCRNPEHRAPKRPPIHWKKPQQKEPAERKRKQSAPRVSRRQAGKVKNRAERLAVAAREFAASLEELVQSGAHAGDETFLNQVAETLCPPLGNLTEVLQPFRLN